MSVAASIRPGRNPLELGAGFVVLLVLVGAMALAVVGKNRAGSEGYVLNAVFDHVDGLGVGSDVRLAGITVGHVTAETVDSKSFHARVSFTVRPDILLPTDTGAIITSDSLLGGKYIALSPGGESRNFKPGATIGQTQGSISLEELLSKFIFSVTDSVSRNTKPNSSAPAPAPGGDKP